MSAEIVIEEDAQKKGRRRKKQLYKSILQQMEFYFSDSNLSKDRFLSNLTKVDPYVDISLFLSFNKIRKLTTSIKHISKAIAKSDILELSEDKTKVKRKLPMVEKVNIDECTLYVERLKTDATHDWLTTIFSEFGKVTYVSIPKYKHSGVIKGFAFVEFENEAGLHAALQYFEKIDCKIPSCLEPEKLCSIESYIIETSEANKQSTSETEEPPSKKSKLEIEDVTEQIDDAMDNEDVPAGDDGAEKKLKKANKKKANLKELGLQILSKKEWKKMRNRYLDMQRKSMKELKMHLNRQRFAQKCGVYKSSAVIDSSPKKESKEESGKSSDIEFVPGVIVKLGLQEACYTVKITRRKVKTYSPNIKYVEIPVGSTDAYLRFTDEKSAQEFCSSEFKEKASLLEGEEEKVYWNKIKESAAAKKEKQTKGKKKERGRDKLLKKAEKHAINHIRFGEEAAE